MNTTLRVIDTPHRGSQNGRMTSEQTPILVIGGTGKTGARVAARLEARGQEVRIGSRSADPSFDWDDRSTWGPALEGTRAAYISFFPDLAVPGAPEAVAALAREALAVGTRRLVLLSGRGEAEAQRAEAELAASGADWTVVRASWFAQNFSEAQFLEPLLAGELALPADAGREPFVDADDIADVAVAALTEPGHSGRVYEVTGPRLLTFGEAVAEIAEASGRELRYQPISMAAFETGAAEAGEPEEVVALLRYLFTEVHGHNVTIGDGVQRALGRPARDFSDYARDAAATGVWSAADGRAA